MRDPDFRKVEAANRSWDTVKPTTIQTQKPHQVQRPQSALAAPISSKSNFDLSRLEPFPFSPDPVEVNPVKRCHVTSVPVPTKFVPHIQSSDCDTSDVDTHRQFSPVFFNRSPQELPPTNSCMTASTTSTASTSSMLFQQQQQQPSLMENSSSNYSTLDRHLMTSSWDPDSSLNRCDSTKTLTNAPDSEVEGGTQPRGDGYEADTDDTLRRRGNLKRRGSVKAIAKNFQEAEDACPAPRPLRPSSSDTENDAEGFTKSRVYVPPRWAAPQPPSEAQESRRDVKVIQSL